MGRYRTKGRPFNWEVRYTTIILTFRPFVQKGGGEITLEGTERRSFAVLL